MGTERRACNPQANASALGARRLSLAPRSRDEGLRRLAFESALASCRRDGRVRLDMEDASAVVILESLLAHDVRIHQTSKRVHAGRRADVDRVTSSRHRGRAPLGRANHSSGAASHAAGRDEQAAPSCKFVNGHSVLLSPLRSRNSYAELCENEKGHEQLTRSFERMGKRTFGTERVDRGVRVERKPVKLQSRLFRRHRALPAPARGRRLHPTSASRFVPLPKIAR
jgi:hypothetical protein